MPGQLYTRPNPGLLELGGEARFEPPPPATEAPTEERIVASGPLVPRNYEGRAVTDAQCYELMFLAIEGQRIEVGARMDEYKWNNDMARAIEKLKNAIQIAIDKILGTDPDKTMRLPPEVSRFVWDNNVPMNGVLPHDKYKSFEEFDKQEFTAAQCRTIVSGLDIEKTKYTDMNSQNMQQTNIALSLLQVFQQLLTALIDMIKRIKEQIASKV
jgi:hypothetical protein